LLRLGAKTLPVALARITRDESDPRDKIHLTNEGTQVFVAPASRRRFCDLLSAEKLPARRRRYGTPFSITARPHIARQMREG
jgi:hypothetical protein